MVMTRFAELGEGDPVGASRRTYDRPRSALPALAGRGVVPAHLARRFETRADDDLGRSPGGAPHTLPPSAFENWLEPLRAVGIQGSRLYVSGPDRVRDWFQRRYGAAATEALRRRAPGFTEIAFADPPAGAEAGQDEAADRRRSDPAGLAAGLDFDHFVIGSGNRFAHSAALAVAESPGESYNPLFLYGSPGLGKTHLLISIANYLRSQRPDLDVAYTTAERFTSEFVTVPARRRPAHRPLQAALPRRRRAADRRRPVPRGQGADRGRVLPHVQRALRAGEPDRALQRPAAGGDGAAQRADARPLRLGSDGRAPGPRPRDPDHAAAPARRRARHRRSPTSRSSSRSPAPPPGTCAASRAR